MNTHSKLETSLRAEARQPVPAPSPHLHGRIMADVRALHAAKAEKRVFPWGAYAAGAVTVLLLGSVALHQLSTRSPDTSQGLALLEEWDGLAHPVDTISAALNMGVLFPFAQETRALASDTERATRFLADCIPL